MFKYLWEATFADGHMISQPVDDRYTGHDDTKAHNLSSFQDILDYQERSPLQFFALVGHDRQIYAVSMETGEFFVNGTTFMLDQPLEELQDRKLIYFRTNRMNMDTQEQYIYAFNFGYKGKHPESGKIMKKVVTIQ